MSRSRTVESKELTPVSPTKPVAPWLGGKRVLAGRIVPLIERVPHTLYAEPFCGMGGVFFRRQMKPKSEVINDVSGDVVTLFRVIQRHYTAFADMLRYQLSSRAEFERLEAQNPATLTDLERAARFLYLQKLAFGGKVVGRSFGVNRTDSSRFNVTVLLPMLDEMHDRLTSVVIENLPYGAFITRYDTPGTMFYLDPPYWGNEEDYGTGTFSRAYFQALAEQLAGLQGRFILSLNDNPGVRDTFKRFRFRAVKATYSINGKKPAAFKEVLISNLEGF